MFDVVLTVQYKELMRSVYMVAHSFLVTRSYTIMQVHQFN